MPLGGLGHGLMPDQSFDDAAMGEAAAQHKNNCDNSDNSSCRHYKEVFYFTTIFTFTLIDPDLTTTMPVPFFKPVTTPEELTLMIFAYFFATE